MGAREDEPRRAPHAVPHQAPGLGFDFFTPHYRTSSRDHLHPTLLLSSSPLSMIAFTSAHAALRQRAIPPGTPPKTRERPLMPVGKGLDASVLGATACHSS